MLKQALIWWFWNTLWQTYQLSHILRDCHTFPLVITNSRISSQMWRNITTFPSYSSTTNAILFHWDKCEWWGLEGNGTGDVYVNLWEITSTVKSKKANLKTSVTRKQTALNFPQNEYFLLHDTHAYVKHKITFRWNIFVCFLLKCT